MQQRIQLFKQNLMVSDMVFIVFSAIELVLKGMQIIQFLDMCFQCLHFFKTAVDLKVKEVAIVL